MFNYNLNYNVSLLLKEKGMQNKDLAEKMGCAPAFVSNTLSGNPTLETLQRIATALSVPVSALLRERNDIFGVVSINGKQHHIDSWDDIYKLVQQHEKAMKRNTF